MPPGFLVIKPPVVLFLGKYPDVCLMSFSKQIVGWYQVHKRDLPWRQTRDPYVIWLSEIILQQTRVDQGLPYFERFLYHYPNIQLFAQADEGEILRHWQGLGYYSRARNMHQAAKLVMSEMRGIFPTSYDQLIRLPGVGDYTASAISSFAAAEPHAVVDGNVFRVLARYFGIDTPINSTKGKKLFRTIAQDILDITDPGTHNQAMMEFGSMLCKPKSPDCGACPVSLGCQALQTNRVNQLPVKIKGKASANRFFNYFIVMDEKQEGLYLEQRTAGDIWANLYQLPLLETSTLATVDELYRQTDLIEWFGKQIVLTPVSGVVKHVLSHQNLHAQFFEVRGQELSSEKKTAWNYVLLKDLNKLAQPKLIYAFLSSYLNPYQP